MDNNPEAFHSCVYFTDGSTLPNCMVTATDDKLASLIEVKISPNPFSSNAKIEIEGNFEPRELIVYNTTEQQIRQVKFLKEDEKIIDRNGLSSGIYFFKLVDKDGQTVSGKFVAE